MKQPFLGGYELAYARVIDAFNLDPPEPLQLAMAAIDDLAIGEFVCLKVSREPLMLYPLLISQGFSHISRTTSPSGYEVFIWCTNDEAAESSALAAIQAKMDNS